jgi:50S ribosomal subunit-associated GTPase HflX
MRTLAAMDCDQPSLLVLNKIDRLTPAEVRAARLGLGDTSGLSPITVSALTGSGLRELRQAIDGLAERAAPGAAKTHGAHRKSEGDDIAMQAAG